MLLGGSGDRQGDRQDDGRWHLPADPLPERTDGSGCGRWWEGRRSAREGRAPGVEGVGPGPVVGTRPGAWSPTRGYLPSLGGRDPGKELAQIGRGSSGPQRVRGIRI